MKSSNLAKKIQRRVGISNRVLAVLNYYKIRKGSVYLLASDCGLFFKIGKSVNVKQRMVTIDLCIMPKGVTVKSRRVIHEIKTNSLTHLEAVLHDVFRDQHVIGEWFLLSNSDIKLLTKLDRIDFELLNGG